MRETPASKGSAALLSDGTSEIVDNSAIRILAVIWFIGSDS